jgi:hypothetical protein
MRPPPGADPADFASKIRSYAREMFDAASNSARPQEYRQPSTKYRDQESARDEIDQYLEQPAERIHPAHHDVLPAGEALAASADSYETRIAHEEMSQMSAAECPFLQNRE